MKITAITVDGFGLLHERRVEPSPGLTVVRGQNEAGKTTLLAFVRSILFGFESNRYRALAGGRRGGWLGISMADGRAFRIERYGERGGLGQLRVLDSGGTDQGSAMLPQLLQGVESKVFRNIFAFGLEELTEFGRLTDNEVAARIYGAGLGLGAVSGLDVENELRAGKEALFKQGGSNPTINAILRELDDLDGRLRTLDLPKEYGAAGLRLGDVDSRLAELANELCRIAIDARSAQRQIDGWPTWLDLQGARVERAELGQTRAYPGDTTERHAVLETTCRAAAENLAKATDHRALREAEFARLTTDNLCLGRRTEIEAVLAEAVVDQTRWAETQRLAHDRDLAKSELGESLRRLGPGWTDERVASFDDSVAIQTEISGRFRTSLDHAAEAPTRIRGEIATTTRGLADTRGELEEAVVRLAEASELLGGRAPADEREAALREVESLLARVDTLRGAIPDKAGEDAGADNLPVAVRLGHARALSIALDREQSLKTLLGSVSPAGPTVRSKSVPAAGAAAILGLVVAGVLAAAGIQIIFSGLAAVTGLSIALLILLWPAGASDGSAGSRAALETQLHQARAEVGLHIAPLGLNEEPTPRQIAEILVGLDRENSAAARQALILEQAQDVAREMAEVMPKLASACLNAGLEPTASGSEIKEKRRSIAADRQVEARRVGLLDQEAILEGRIETLGRRHRELEADLLAAEQGATAARDEWATWLTRRGLDSTVDRETAARIVDAVTAAKRPLATVGSLDARLVTLRSDHAAFLAAFGLLADLLPDGRFGEEHLSVAVSELTRRLKLAEKQERDRQEAAEEIVVLRRAEDEARSSNERTSGEYAAFLAEFDAASAEVLRVDLERSRRAESLDARISMGAQALAALSGPGRALGLFEETLAAIEDIQSVEARLNDCTSAADALEAERSNLQEEAGALRNQRAEMERDVSATVERQRESDLRARLEAEAERWSVLALATEIVTRSRAAYERAHRPAVVETAERYVREWTDGQYNRIIAPLGGQIEAMEHRDGSQVPLAGLSRGTAELLYLALRFGLVEHFAAGAEPLPIVMDDILVNFDDERAARAARSIEELATRQQVMYFTCHPETPLRGALEISLPRLRTVADAVAAPA
jgi:uncharacterized protein YhaN